MMFWYQVALIFFGTIMLMTEADDDEVGNQMERQGCGQYGFLCLDEKTLEFCPVVVDGIADRAETHECDDDFYCDEDNPAYCTPKEPPNKLVLEAKKGDSHGGGGGGILGFVPAEANDDLYLNEEGYYRGARAVNESKVEEGVCETTIKALSEPSTTEMDGGDEFTTAEFTPSPPFECDTYGFFADKYNSSLFWYCDVPLNGAGFLLRHMMCGRDRHYDDLLKNCVLEDTIRHERKLNADSKKVNRSMNCMNKKPGKYADETNCRIYHLCLSKEFSPAVQLTFLCSRGTAYDATSKSCTIAAFNRCQVKGQPESKNNINCRSPTRFRSTEDCSSYFLCFVDNVIEIKCPKFYKFDDAALECLPEKVAECKEYTI